MDDAAARARALWSLGRYAVVAERLQPAAERLCDAAGVAAGMRVLDVGAGTGNVAVAAAARGADVVASDITPALIEQGRARTGDAVAWREADARALPFADGSFDAVLSAFGAMYAPEPERVARELLRVTAPGGVAGLTAWAPGGVQAAALEVLARHLPMPADGPSPDAWGDAAQARAWLGPHAAGVEVREHALHWRFAGGARTWISEYEAAAPTVVAARAAIGDERWPAVREELRAAATASGRTEPDGTFVVEPRYVVVLARAA